MNLFDFIVIYLACGAPFAVYHFLQHGKMDWRMRWIQSLLYFLFWVPFAAGTLYRIFASARPSDSVNTGNSREETLIDTRLDDLQKRIEHLMTEADKSLPVFEFREIINRYAGLTLEINRASFSSQEEIGHELFDAAGNHGNELSSICLRRRNLKRLVFHQELSREDFIRVAGHAVSMNGNSSELDALLLELFDVLGDSKARASYLRFAEQRRPALSTFRDVGPEVELAA